MTRPRIYLSGPITHGHPSVNLVRSYGPHLDLIQHGYAPLNPILTTVVPFADNVSHSDWLEVDKAWINAADGLLRLAGHSLGADEEVAFAITLGIPVFHDLKTLYAHFERN